MCLLEDIIEAVELYHADSDPEIQFVRLAFEDFVAVHEHVHGLVSELVSESLNLFLDHLLADLDAFMSFALEIVHNDALSLSGLQEIEPFALRFLILCSDDLDLVTCLEHI